MFTGIIESLGTIQSITKSNNNIHFTIESKISNTLKVDQSVAHNGVCLTITACNEFSHTVTAIEETLQKSALSHWQIGDSINLERAMIMGARLDGHIVQGHVDSTGICEKITDKSGSIEYTFSFPVDFEHLVIEKGSICINGISLTAFNCHRNMVTVAIIPYTLQHTNMHNLKIGDTINIEYDIVGKYITKLHKK
jgi:riboflavin synthase